MGLDGMGLGGEGGTHRTGDGGEEDGDEAEENVARAHDEGFFCVEINEGDGVVISASLNVVDDDDDEMGMSFKTFFDSWTACWFVKRRGGVEDYAAFQDGVQYLVPLSG